MRSSPLFLITFPLTVLGQEENLATVTLVEPSENVNSGDFIATVPLLGQATDQYSFAGTLELQLNIDIATGTTDELTVLSADLAITDLNLSNSAPFGSFIIETQDVHANVFTITPPGSVNPETGIFAANQHALTFDQGTLESSVTPILSSPIIFNQNFETQPLAGIGQDTGTITVTPGRLEGSRQYYDLVLELPFDLDVEVNIAGSDITLEASSIYIATGETFLEIDFEAWSALAGAAEAEADTTTITPSAPNFVVFALGYGPQETPDQIFELTPESSTLNFGTNEARANITIERSADLNTWERVPDSKMISGSSTILTGASLETAHEIARDDDYPFLRICANSAPPVE